MKEKLSTATWITTTVLFYILAMVKVPFLFCTAFVLLLIRGGVMYAASISEDYELNEQQPKENINKLILIRLVWQLFSILFVGACLFLFFYRKEVWMQVFSK